MKLSEERRYTWEIIGHEPPFRTAVYRAGMVSPMHTARGHDSMEDALEWINNVVDGYEDRLLREACVETGEIVRPPITFDVPDTFDEWLEGTNS
ncbi:MAG: hypothetical protein ACREBC_29535 [Pyrinomonadaceae bacterium]